MGGGLGSDCFYGFYHGIHHQIGLLMTRTYQLARWCQLKHFYFFPRNLGGNDLILPAYFSDALVQPPASDSLALDVKANTS